MAWSNNLLLIIAAICFLFIFTLILLYTFTGAFALSSERENNNACSERNPHFCSAEEFNKICGVYWSPECDISCHKLADPCTVQICEKSQAGKQCSPCNTGLDTAECLEPSTVDRYCHAVDEEGRSVVWDHCVDQCNSSDYQFCEVPFCQHLAQKDAKICNVCKRAGAGLRGCPGDLTQQQAYCDLVGEEQCIFDCRTNDGADFCESTPVCQVLGLTYAGLCNVCTTDSGGLAGEICRNASAEVQREYCSDPIVDCRRQCKESLELCASIEVCAEDYNDSCNVCAESFTSLSCANNPQDQFDYCQERPELCAEHCHNPNQAACDYAVCENFPGVCQVCNPIATNFFSNRCKDAADESQLACDNAGTQQCIDFCAQTDDRIVDICEHVYCRSNTDVPASACQCVEEGLDRCNNVLTCSQNIGHCQQICDATCLPGSTNCAESCSDLCAPDGSGCVPQFGQPTYISSGTHPGMALEIRVISSTRAELLWAPTTNPNVSIILETVREGIGMRVSGQSVLWYPAEENGKYILKNEYIPSAVTTVHSTGFRNQYYFMVGQKYMASFWGGSDVVVSSSLVKECAYGMLFCNSITLCEARNLDNRIFDLMYNGRVLSLTQQMCPNVPDLLQFMSPGAVAPVSMVEHQSHGEQQLWYFDYQDTWKNPSLVNYRFFTQYLAAPSVNRVQTHGIPVPVTLVPTSSGFAILCGDFYLTVAPDFSIGTTNFVGEATPFTPRTYGTIGSMYRPNGISPSPYDLGSKAENIGLRLVGTNHYVQFTTNNINVVTNPESTDNCLGVRCNFQEGSGITGNMSIGADALSVCFAPLGYQKNTTEVRGMDCDSRFRKGERVEKHLDEINDALQISRRRITNYLAFYHDGSFAIVGTPAKDPCVPFDASCGCDTTYLGVKYNSATSQLVWAEVDANLQRFEFVRVA